MAVRVIIYETCPRCGHQNARPAPDGIVAGHNCIERPPGPPSAPRTLSPGSVVFVIDPPKGEMVKTPAICNSCKLVIDCPTMGVTMDRCPCCAGKLERY